jgi:deoxyribodipyrimidine photo-lyase
MIERERIRNLNQRAPAKGQYVLYWMQASQRTEDNHALLFAIEKANELKLPVIVYFGLTGRYPDARKRHYRFMLEGLRELRQTLRDMNISLVLRMESPEKGVCDLSKGAAMVVADVGYTKLQREWRSHAAVTLECPFIEIESDVIVPVGLASQKEQYSAATLRPRIRELLPWFLRKPEPAEPLKSSLGLELDSASLDDTDALLLEAGTDGDKDPPLNIHGGEKEAASALREFIAGRLENYGSCKNDPSLDCTSHLSPYIHFGQISTLSAALEAKKSAARGCEAFIEELIVRRELSCNFLRFNESYHSYVSLPEWARKTLDSHRGDSRETLYSYEELEAASTHDPYWNAAQKEMVVTGRMHGYMRMYWGKKIIEWSSSPEEAFSTAISLNNRYELDGRDPNGYAGVAWCFGKHDRPWKERPVFGTVRYMNARGLERKFDIKAYVDRINSLSR